MKQKLLKNVLSVSLVAGMCTAGSASAAVYLVDFGLNLVNVNANPTTSPDTNGNYWNNIYSDGGAGSAVSAGTSGGITDIVSTDNTVSSIDLTMGVNWRASNFGALGENGNESPNSALLGDFAIGTATGDYFYVEGTTTTAAITISGLDPTKTYDFRLGLA